MSARRAAGVRRGRAGRWRRRRMQRRHVSAAFPLARREPAEGERAGQGVGAAGRFPGRCEGRAAGRAPRRAGITSPGALPRRAGLCRPLPGYRRRCSLRPPRAAVAGGGRRARSGGRCGMWGPCAPVGPPDSLWGSSARLELPPVLGSLSQTALHMRGVLVFWVRVDSVR